MDYNKHFEERIEINPSDDFLFKEEETPKKKKTREI